MAIAQTLTPNEEIEQLKTLVSSMVSSVKNQHEILRKRNLELPMEALQALTDFESELAMIAEQMGSEITELNQLRALAETSALINTSLDLDTVLANAMDEIINLTGAERGFIIIKNADTGKFDSLIARPQENSNSSLSDIGVSSGILERVINSGEPLLTDNAHEDARLLKSNTVLKHGLRSVLCVPLKYKDQPVTSAVYVDNRFKPGVFGHGEVNLLAAFANQVAVAIENARLYANVQATLAEITAMKELMDNVFESIGSGVITSNAQDIVTTYNRAAGEILNQEAVKAIGQPLPRVLPRLSADFEDKLVAVREQNRSDAIESSLETEQGHLILSAKLSPLKDSNNTVQGIAVVVDDLTEQREREERFSIVKRYLPPQMVDQIHDIAKLAFGGARREVSCMFVDVRPLNTLPPGMRPQQIMEMVNIHLNTATEIIHEVGGVIDKYMGNEIMVVFNSQLNPEPDDHALRAVHAALALRDGFLDLYKELDPSDTNPHYYRIGIHTGVATLGNVGS